MVFIVDALDQERFPEAKRELDVRLSLPRSFGCGAGWWSPMDDSNEPPYSVPTDPATHNFLTYTEPADVGRAGARAVPGAGQQDRRAPCRVGGAAAVRAGPAEHLRQGGTETRACVVVVCVLGARARACVLLVCVCTWNGLISSCRPLFCTMGQNTGEKQPGVRPIELYMCSVIKRMGYADGFKWLAQFL